MSISSFAQVQWDVTVRKEPDYTKYGVKYQPTETPSRSVPDPNKTWNKSIHTNSCKC